MTRSKLLSAALIVAAAAPAYASDQIGTTYDQWKEEFTAADTSQGTTDAGNLPITANVTRGAGGLNKITGSLSRTDDVDMYCIRINNPAAFSATTTGAGNSSDTNLALFSLAGVALSFNDNANGTTTRSSLSGTNVPGPGLYYLAISRNDLTFGGNTYTRPLDGLGDLIFPGPPNHTVLATNDPLRTGEFAPTTAGTVVAGWEVFTGGFSLFSASYSIDLTGADYHLVPTPGSGALLSLGGLAGLRRRRR